MAVAAGTSGGYGAIIKPTPLNSKKEGGKRKVVTGKDGDRPSLPGRGMPGLLENRWMDGWMDGSVCRSLSVPSP